MAKSPTHSMAQFFRCILHRFNNVLIARAAAQISFETFANFILRRMRIAPEKLVSSKDHAGRAETALQPVLLPETLLQWMQEAVVCQPFDGKNFRAVRLNGKHGA